MNNLIVNSCLAILSFKRAVFEERVKTAKILDKISSKVKEFFDRYNSDELIVMLRHKQSDDDSGIVELRPFVHKIISRRDRETGELKKVKVLVPAEEGETPLDTVHMTQEEYQNYLQTEGISKREEQDLRTYDPLDISEEEKRILDKLEQPGIILITDIRNRMPYMLTDIVRTDEGIKYEISDIHTDEKQLISREEMKSDFRVPRKYRTVLEELIAEKESEFRKEPEEGDLELDTEKYDKIRQLVIKKVKQEKAKGKEVTQAAIKKAVNNLLEKEGIPAYKFWAWLADEQEFERKEREEAEQMDKKLRTIASMLGTTLTKTADFLTELNPDEEKPAFDKETNKEVTVNKDTTAEGRPVVTIGDKDNTEKKTYDANSPELKNITDDLSQIIAFTSEHRKVLAELGYTI